jgi:uncharacterized membrane protein
MESLGLLILLGFAFVFVVPLIAIVALVRANRAANAVGGLGLRTDGMANLDMRLAAMDRKLDKLLLAGPPAGPAAPAPSPSGAAAVSAPAATQPAQPMEQVPPVPATPAPHAPKIVVPPVHLPEEQQMPQGVLPAPSRPPMPPQRPATATPSGTGGAPHVNAAPGQASAQASVQSGPSFSVPLTSPGRGAGGGQHGIDWEELIAGRWLIYVGILALAIAVAFFLKYAFDNNWIGPSGRVAIGVGIGTGLFVLSHWLQRGYPYFSEGIAGLGAAVLYLSIWSGWHYYHLFPQNTAFVLMVLATAAVLGVAVARNSERIAVLATIGGLLTPMLVSTGRNEETALFSYVAVLGAGVLWIAFQREWKTLPPIQFAATAVYFWGWYNEFYAAKEQTTTVFFATVFFILFAALPIVRSLRGQKLPELEILIVVANATQYLIALRWMLWPAERWELTAALVALAVVHFVVAEAVPKREAEAARVAKTLYIALALTFITLAIPIGLDDEWITIAWAAEGALAIWCGLRFRAGSLRVLGFILFGVVGVRLIAYPIHASPTFLLNARFVTQALCAAAFLSAFLFAKQSDEELEEGGAKAYYVLAGAANLLFLVALSQEVWNFYGRTSVGMNRALAQELALSVLWVAYALALMVLGVRLKSAGLRWQALALLGVAIAKVFFFDLSFLTRFYRIVSFFVLGLVLLLVSFFYQRRSTTKA